MSAPNCDKCGTPMASTSSIGTGGHYCPSPECTGANGVQFQLNHSPGGARAVRALTVCWFEIMSVTCARCSLKYNKKDPIDRDYHEKPGGCR